MTGQGIYTKYITLFFRVHFCIHGFPVETTLQDRGVYVYFLQRRLSGENWKRRKKDIPGVLPRPGRGKDKRLFIGEIPNFIYILYWSYQVLGNMNGQKGSIGIYKLTGKK